MATEPGSDDGASVPTGEAADMRGASQEMAMFPLGSVLLPSMLVSLHVFEDRYRTMVEHVLAAAEPTFGIVLIERGSEVGGQDVRTDVNAAVRVIHTATEIARLTKGDYVEVTVTNSSASGR